jgi:hypothetical protein
VLVKDDSTVYSVTTTPFWRLRVGLLSKSIEHRCDLKTTYFTSNANQNRQTAWDTSAWIASDDRVRGGQSQSHLSAHNSSSVLFHGHLDITALGGAGFASQRTVEADRIWDLAAWDGVLLMAAKSDLAAKDQCKTFTFVVKDTILPPDPDTGREQSTISWEGHFTLDDLENGHSASRVVFRWSDLRPFYRGKEVVDGKASLDTGKIKRFSIMVRRYERPLFMHIESLIEKQLWGATWEFWLGFAVHLGGQFCRRHQTWNYYQ